MKQVVPIKLDNQSIVDMIVCTNKGRSVLENSSHDISGRERQFLRLLSNDDYISRRACLRVVTKVPLENLLQEGLIAEKANDGKLLRLLKEINNPSPDSNFVTNEVPKSPDPLLQVMAGAFV